MPATPPASGSAAYYCPMHKDVRQAGPGACAKCGMDLVPEGARFGLLRHMLGMPRHMLKRPWLVAVMLAAMAAAMAALMMR